jgi:hypothetical protein
MKILLENYNEYTQDYIKKAVETLEKVNVKTQQDITIDTIRQLQYDMSYVLYLIASVRVYFTDEVLDTLMVDLSTAFRDLKDLELAYFKCRIEIFERFYTEAHECITNNGANNG